VIDPTLILLQHWQVLPVPKAVQLAHGKAAKALYLFEEALNKTSLRISTTCQVIQTAHS